MTSTTQKPLGFLLAAVVLLMTLTLGGCGGDDDPMAPGPDPDPELSLSMSCGNGRIILELRNLGGNLREPVALAVAFADGTRDTLFMSVGAVDSTSCRLSNIHGGVTVTNEEWALSATTGDCLEGALSGLMDDFDIEALIPDPLLVQNIALCTYTISMDNLTYDAPDFELTRTATGLDLKYTYRNINGDIEGTAPGFLCPDVEGDLEVSSIVTTTKITIVQGSDPRVTLGKTTTTVSGLDVTIDGIMGFLAGWLVNFFEDDFAFLLEQGVEQAVGSLVGSDLGDLFIVNSECGR